MNKFPYGYVWRNGKIHRTRQRQVKIDFGSSKNKQLTRGEQLQNKRTHSGRIESTKWCVVCSLSSRHKLSRPLSERGQPKRANGDSATRTSKRAKENSAPLRPASSINAHAQGYLPHLNATPESIAPPHFHLPRFHSPSPKNLSSK